MEGYVSAWPHVNRYGANGPAQQRALRVAASSAGQGRPGSDHGLTMGLDEDGAEWATP